MAGHLLLRVRRSPVPQSAGHAAFLTRVFSAIELGPLRLLNFAAFAVVLYWLSHRVRWSAVRALSVRWLAFVGRHSLPVFAWSILATYAAVAILPTHPGLAAGVLSALLVTASLTIPAQARAVYVRWRVVAARSKQLAAIEPAAHSPTSA